MNEMKRENSVPDEYKCLSESFLLAGEIIGGKNLDDIEDLTEEQVKSLSNIKTQILKQCISIVKKSGNSDFLEELESEWKGDFFWRKLKERLENRTMLFLMATDLRNMPQNEREELLNKIFYYYYFERETTEFVSKELQIDKCLVCTAFKIIERCEHLYVFQHYSKRRFVSNIVEASGLELQEIEVLWKCFYDNENRISQFAIAETIESINRTLDGLVKRADSIDDTLEINSNAILDLYNIIGNQDSQTMTEE